MRRIFWLVIVIALFTGSVFLFLNNWVFNFFELNYTVYIISSLLMACFGGMLFGNKVYPFIK